MRRIGDVKEVSNDLKETATDCERSSFRMRIVKRKKWREWSMRK